MNTTYELVTPQLAEEWLKKNMVNRPVSKTRVEGYADDIKNDRWQRTHQGIAFGANGQLYDGQHRLYAIIKAEVAVWLLITRGLPPEAREVLDIGRVRTMGDNLALANDAVSQPKRVTAAIRILRVFFGHSLAALSSTDVHRYYTAFKLSFDWVLSFPIVRRISIAPVDAALVFAWYTSQEEIRAFGEQVLVGANLGMDAPAFELRTALLAGSTVGGRSLSYAYKTLHAAALYLDHRPSEPLSGSNKSVFRFRGDAGAALVATVDARYP